MAFFAADDPNLPDKLLEVFDQQVRQVIRLFWKALPDDKRSLEAVEIHIRRIVDRALHDLREDFDNFFKSDEEDG